MSSTRRVLADIHLLKCSLLPGELLTFIEDAASWESLLDAYAADPEALEPAPAMPPAQFRVRAEGSDVWFDIALPPGYGEDARLPSVDVKGDQLGRTEQQRWQALVAEALEEVRGSEYPLYELISSHLLPQLHSDVEETERSCAPSPEEAPPISATAESSSRYHALFTSHHLKSPQKRRSLSQWAHELSLMGFSKVGYPGVIYCEGAREDVEDFVSRVKSMQWLALRLRFLESLPPAAGANEVSRREWKEFEKVGEVVGEMRAIGRERFVVEMGIGSLGTGIATAPSKTDSETSNTTKQ
ncbi:hypothetical protein BN946_scf185013.g22 [Trametes cinnabarina]|uniref:Small nuclear ribonucleoprotein Prp3 C-terminal domain-containing protein n=1 Tax=Pycnoporus cinnabarinus TaxID=5643 RepID=A0A060SLT6_PYCCI|nr:hypothetical protein BN946_scf185013.g22 [Trametes cinnabarina]